MKEKKTMSYNKAMLRVCAFASTDETRPELMYCIHDKDSKALVATDGHRAIWDRSLYQDAAKPFKASTYLKTSDMVAPDWEGFKYPNVQSFRPNENDYSDPIEFKIPLWIGKLKGYKKQDSKAYFDVDGNMSLTGLKKYWSVCLNMALIVPLADSTVKMRFKMTKATEETPSVVDTTGPVWIILDSDCDAVIMPLRV